MRLIVLFGAFGVLALPCSQSHAATVVGNPKLVGTIWCYGDLAVHAPVQSLLWTFTNSQGGIVTHRNNGACNLADWSCVVDEPTVPWSGLSITINAPILVDCGDELVNVPPQSIWIGANGAGFVNNGSDASLWLHVDQAGQP